MRPPMVFGIVMTRRVGSLGSVALGRWGGAVWVQGGGCFFPCVEGQRNQGGVAQAEQG